MLLARLGFAVALGLALLATPALAQTAPTPPKPAAQPNDLVGEDVTLTARTMVLVKGVGTWDTAFDTLTGSSYASASSRWTKNWYQPGLMKVVLSASSV